jgi:hypothetical protein
MSRTARAVVACLGVLVICASASAQMPEGWDRLLGPNRGRPYQGLIRDSDTKRPLSGVVIVALWRRERVYPLQVNTERYAVRETVTDSTGRFLMEVKDIEEGAPRRTRKPEFLAFLPGLRSNQDRLNNLSSFGPHSFSDRPHRDLPQLMRAIDEERVALGLQPYPTQEKE